jgi:site-specific recombinase XerD
MWRVRLGRKFTKAGVVERNFATLDAAREFIHGTPEDKNGGIQALRSKFGITAIEISPRELAEAREALALLRESKEGTLREAVCFYLAHHSPSSRVSFANAIESFLTAKRGAGLVAQHISELESQIKSLSNFAKVAHVSDITRDHVEKWIGEKKVAQRTKANSLRDARNFFRFCRARGMMAHDPLAGIERPRIVANETGIITPVQARLLLNAADPEILPALAVKLFAGLRTSEVRRLDWCDITASHVIVRACNAKTRSRRVVDICECLSAWLAPFRQLSGALVSLSREEWHKRIREAAERVNQTTPTSHGIDLSITPQPAIGKLPSNFARHSFGTYHFALHQDEGRTAAAMGNTPAMVHRHYRALATKEDAWDFFKIMPDTSGQILAFAT